MLRTKVWPLLAALLLIPAVVTHADEDPELSVTKCVLRLKPPKADRAANHVVNLKARFDADDLTADIDLFEEHLRVTIGGQTVFELPAVEERKRLRQRNQFIWRLRDGRRSRMQLDTLLGRLSIATRKLDLTALRDAGPQGVELVMELGDSTYRGSVTFVDKKHRWRFRAAKPVPETPIRPQPGNVPVEVIAQGDFSGIQDARTVVIRDLGAWNALWIEHTSNLIPAPDLPIVDFTEDMVVAVWRGEQPSPANRVLHGGTNSDGQGYVVSHIEADTIGSCAFPTVVTQPHFILKVPRITGPVTFDKLSAVEICHGSPGQ